MRPLRRGALDSGDTALARSTAAAALSLQTRSDALRFSSKPYGDLLMAEALVAAGDTRAAAPHLAELLDHSGQVVRNSFDRDVHIVAAAAAPMRTLEVYLDHVLPAMKYELGRPNPDRLGALCAFFDPPPKFRGLENAYDPVACRSVGG